MSNTPQIKEGPTTQHDASRPPRVVSFFNFGLKDMGAAPYPLPAPDSLRVAPHKLLLVGRRCRAVTFRNTKLCLHAT